MMEFVREGDVLYITKLDMTLSKIKDSLENILKILDVNKTIKQERRVRAS